MKIGAILLIIFFSSSALLAQNDSTKAKLDSAKLRIDPTKTYTTAHLKGEPPVIDGQIGRAHV